MTYAEKLKDPRWQKKRLEILQRDRWICKSCYDSTTTLHVHHTKYSKEPWDADNKHLITLCERCHKSEEENRKQRESDFLNAFYGAGFLSWDLEQLTAALNAYNHDLPHVTDVTSSAISSLISDRNKLSICIEEYFKSLSNG